MANALKKKQNKRKRADLTAKADNDDQVELEPDLEKKKKRKEEKDTGQIAQEKGFNSGLNSPRLKTASRTQKENSIASTAAAPRKPLAKKATQPSSASKKTTKRGPPKSVLDQRID
ncbi:hypothetical protein GGU11DRAFT_748319 [Lentinula aff. detonsa]|nr:hypothetical protein GGU11DRAFT_748319 [Lentinula aff. detonsa]